MISCAPRVTLENREKNKVGNILLGEKRMIYIPKPVINVLPAFSEQSHAISPWARENQICANTLAHMTLACIS